MGRVCIHARSEPSPGCHSESSRVRAGRQNRRRQKKPCHLERAKRVERSPTRDPSTRSSNSLARGDRRLCHWRRAKRVKTLGGGQGRLEIAPTQILRHVVPQDDSDDGHADVRRQSHRDTSMNKARYPLRFAERSEANRMTKRTRPQGRRPLETGFLGCQLLKATRRLTTARRAGVPGLTFRGR
jgi:hypothetical protein